MQKQPTRVHKSQLPKSLKVEADKEGFIHGYFALFQNSPRAQFMCGKKVLFECSRPFVICSTHLFIRYSGCIYAVPLERWLLRVGG